MGLSFWFPNSGATHHLTSDLANLSLQSEYTGPDQVHIGNGSGLRISHLGTSSFVINNSNFHLYSILHVPSIYKNLYMLPNLLAIATVSLNFTLSSVL